MISKSCLAKILVGLVETNDADLVDDDSILSSDVCAVDDRSSIRQLRNNVQLLYRKFDYTASPEFIAKTEGKSDEYVAMLTKRMRDPQKRAQHRQTYARSIASMLSDDRVYELTAPNHHKILDDLRAGFKLVKNPEVTNAG